MILLVIVLFLIVAAIADAAMDLIDFKYSQSIFSKFKKWEFWFNPAISWKNKYKNKDPQQGPAFFGSTTFLAWVTDAWHFFQSMMITSLVIPLVLCIDYIFLIEYSFAQSILIDVGIFFLIKIVYGLTFELFWSKILIKKL